MARNITRRKGTRRKVNKKNRTKIKGGAAFALNNSNSLERGRLSKRKLPEPTAVREGANSRNYRRRYESSIERAVYEKGLLQGLEYTLEQTKKTLKKLETYMEIKRKGNYNHNSKRNDQHNLIKIQKEIKALEDRILSEMQRIEMEEEQAREREQMGAENKRI